MKTSSWRAVACALLAVALWASVASSGSAEAAGGEHGWVKAGVAASASTERVEWDGGVALTETGPADSGGPCPLDWRLRGLMIGGACQAAEQLRKKLPVISMIVAARGSDLSHWFALLPWNGI
jgi:hypothetical protein